MANLKRNSNPRFSEDMSKLMGLSSLVWDYLIEKLQRVEVKMTTTDHVHLVVEQALQAHAINDITEREISRIILGLLFLRVRSPSDANEFTREVIDGLAPDVTEEESGISLLQFGEYLQKLFSARNLYISAKGAALATEYERLLIETKIITDVRPIFENSEETSVLGYILMHTLKLSIEGSSDTEDICVALSDELLTALDAQIQRTKRKSETLSQALGISLGPRVEEE